MLDVGGHFQSAIVTEHCFQMTPRLETGDKGNTVSLHGTDITDKKLDGFSLAHSTIRVQTPED